MSSWTTPFPVEPKVSIAKNSPSSIRVASPPVCVCVCMCVCLGGGGGMVGWVLVHSPKAHLD